MTLLNLAIRFSGSHFLMSGQLPWWYDKIILFAVFSIYCSITCLHGSLSILLKLLYLPCHSEMFSTITTQRNHFPLLQFIYKGMFYAIPISLIGIPYYRFYMMSRWIKMTYCWAVYLLVAGPLQLNSIWPQFFCPSRNLWKNRHVSPIFILCSLRNFNLPFCILCYSHDLQGQFRSYIPITYSEFKIVHSHVQFICANFTNYSICTCVSCCYPGKVQICYKLNTSWRLHILPTASHSSPVHSFVILILTCATWWICNYQMEELLEYLSSNCLGFFNGGLRITFLTSQMAP